MGIGDNGWRGGGRLGQVSDWGRCQGIEEGSQLGLGDMAQGKSYAGAGIGSVDEVDTGIKR